MTDGKNAENACNFICEKCDFVCSKKSNYEKHLMTLKHINTYKILTVANEKMPNNIETLKTYFCNCGSAYKHRQSLYNHKKKCNYIKQSFNNYNSDSDSDSDSDSEIDNKYKNNVINNGLTEQLVIELIKQNKELLEIVKTGTHNNNSINTTHTNSHNKAFNLNFFLNETCKEAMNIGEFVDSLKIQFDDLENTGEVGYIKGISNIIVKNLKELDVTKRPVHCTDKKRETCYVKDNNVWEKDDDKKFMHKLVKKVVFKNVDMCGQYKDEHPDCLKYHSKYNDRYHKIVFESMGGKGDDDNVKNEKIIKNILKEVVIDKTTDVLT